VTPSNASSSTQLRADAGHFHKNVHPAHASSALQRPQHASASAARRRPRTVGERGVVWSEFLSPSPQPCESTSNRSSLGVHRSSGARLSAERLSARMVQRSACGKGAREGSEKDPRRVREGSEKGPRRLPRLCGGRAGRQQCLGEPRGAVVGVVHGAVRRPSDQMAEEGAEGRVERAARLEEGVAARVAAEDDGGERVLLERPLEGPRRVADRPDPLLDRSQDARAGDRGPREQEDARVGKARPSVAAQLLRWELLIGGGQDDKSGAASSPHAAPAAGTPPPQRSIALREAGRSPRAEAAAAATPL